MSHANGPTAHLLFATSPSHAGVAEEMLEGTGCAKVYEELELCLAEHERSFAKCAAETAAFRGCMDAFADTKLALAQERNGTATERSTNGDNA